MSAAGGTRFGDRDFWSGIAFAAFGVAALVLGRDLHVGSAAEMGEGYVPYATALGLIALGAAIALHAWWRWPDAGGPIEPIRWRPLVFVTSAMLAFAAALEPLGLMAAVAASVTAASFAGEPLRARSLAALVIVLSVGATAVFVWGLGLPVSALPRF